MKSRAFTLVEIVVVITILAILTALLFPVFARAKIKAHEATCLHQISGGVRASHLYAGDWDDALPLGPNNLKARIVGGPILNQKVTATGRLEIYGWRSESRRCPRDENNPSLNEVGNFPGGSFFAWVGTSYDLACSQEGVTISLNSIMSDGSALVSDIGYFHGEVGPRRGRLGVGLASGTVKEMAYDEFLALGRP